jgi:hypothetical protein
MANVSLETGNRMRTQTLTRGLPVIGVSRIRLAVGGLIWATGAIHALALLR